MVIYRLLFSAALVAFLSLNSHPVFAARKSLAVEEEKRSSSFQLQPGNRLEITVYRESDLSGSFEIDPAGSLPFPLIGEIEAAGLEIEELRQVLTLRLKKYLVNPQVRISRSAGTIKSISLLGHVGTPGMYDFVPGSTLMRLVSTAGGFAPSANKRKIKITRTVNGEKKVIVANGLDIVNGKRTDLKIEPGDIIFIPESIF